MKCRACVERGKTWSGDDPICGWEGPIAHNWDCATIGKLRSIADRNQFAKYLEDTNIATIPVDYNDTTGWIVLSWYKSRGRTSTAMFIFDEECHELTLKEAEDCIEYYNFKKVDNE